MCNSIIYDNGTNIGIGTITPGAKLEVNGQIKITGGAPGAGKVLTSDALGLSTWATPTVGTVTSITAGTGLTGGAITASGTIALSIPVSIANGGTNITTIGPAGSVLYSNGTQHASTIAGTAGQVLTSAGAGVPTWTTPATGNNWSILGNAATTPSTSANGAPIGAGQNYVGTTDAKDFIVGSNNIERLRVTSNGYIGIGNTTPTAALHVGYIGMGGATPAKIQVDCGAEAISVRSANQGSTTIPVAIFCEGPNYGGAFPVPQDYTANNIALKLSPWAGGEIELALADWTGTNLMKIARPTNPSLRLAFGNSTTEVLSILSSGNVGIGITSPVSPLTIGTQAVGGENLRLNSIGTANEGGQATFMDAAGSGGWEIDNITSGPDYFLRFFRDKAAPTLTAMVIGSNGNVGIGTTAPGAKLEVAGQVKITGGTPGLNKILTSDAAGLASWQAPSASGQATDNTALSTTSTIWADMASMSVTVTTSGGNLLLSFTTQTAVAAVGQLVGFRFTVDGTPVTAAAFGNSMMQGPPGTGAYYQSSLSATWLATGISAGAHTVKMQWIVSAGATAVAPETPGEASDRTLVVVEIK